MPSLRIIGISRKEALEMHRFKRACGALMAGVLTISVFAASGCRSNGKMRDDPQTDVSMNTSETTSEPSVPKQTETSDIAYQCPVSSSEKEAKALALELGLPPEDLHGKYDLFLKYADCVINNPRLIEYRGFVVNLFPMVADHLEPEDEEYFLSELRELTFESIYLGSNSGDFQSWSNSIRIFGDGTLYETEATYETTMHELTHFFDAFCDQEWESTMALVDGRLAYREDLTEEQWMNAKEYYTASFIVEGGAELYNGKYFTKHPFTYNGPHNFLTGFEWIFGSDALDKMFFSRNSTEIFIGYMKDIGYTDEQIVNVIHSFNSYTYDYIEAPEHPVRFEDVLIDLYEHEKKTDWKEDKVFCQILRQISPGTYDNIPLKHEEVSDILMPYSEQLDFANSIFNSIDQGDNPAAYGIFDVLILDGKPYLSTELIRAEGVDKTRPTTLLVDYDFDTGKVLSYEYYVHSYPQVCPKPLDTGKALDKRLASLIHDHSKLLSQKPYAGKDELKEVYERAAAIGNKYGVYIRVGEDLPPYAEPYVFDLGTEKTFDAKKINDMLDIAEGVLSQFPDGYFAQFDYGYFKGFEICIFEWPLYSDLNTFWTEDGYIMSYSMDSVCTEDINEIRSGLIRAIFDATNMKLRNYFDNFTDPMFSESVWRSKNPAQFYYTGYMTDDIASEEYETYKDYVVSKDGMLSGRMDRILLMEAVLDKKDITEQCKEKARFYSQCIREAFDDSTWPDETTWEAFLSSSKEDSKAA